MSLNDSYEDVVLWESIRYRVERNTEALVEDLEDEIPKDDLLRRYQNEKPVPYQLRRIMEHRANGWAQRAYNICCAAWGQAITREFDRAVWTFAVEPFIDKHFYDFLLRAAGIRFPTSWDMLSRLFGNLPRLGAPQATGRFVPPAGPDVDERHLITVDQRRCCEEVKGRVSRLWRAKLMLGLSEDPEITEAVRVLSRARQMEVQAMRVARGLPPVPVPAAASSRSTHESPQTGSQAFTPDPKTPTSTIEAASDVAPAPSNEPEGIGLTVLGEVDLPPEELEDIEEDIDESESAAATAPPIAESATDAHAAHDDLPQTAPAPLSAAVPASFPMRPVQKGSETEPQAGTKGDMSAQSSGAGTATWDTIEISFLSDQRVQIRNGTNSETLNYAEFGFKDGRTGNPNRAWETMRALAQRCGVIQDGTAMDQLWPKVEKRIQEIRKILREHFGISADPIPFVSGVGYQARFKIGCSPSFHT